MSQMPTGSYGWAAPRFLKVNAEAVGDAGLAQEPPRLGPARGDVAAVAGELLELRRRGGPRRARHLDAADLLDHGDPRQAARGAVAVQGQRQRAADALVVEGLPLVVDAPPATTQSHGLSCTVIFEPSA